MAIHQQPYLIPKRAKVRQVLPAVLMRAGTSKGLFIHRKHLPSHQDQWIMPLLAAMGSKNNEPRQIDGVGGATSTTSKVAIVSPSQRPGIDVDYTFAQVAVGKETVDFSGNCGNMASAVGPFALDEGLVVPKSGQTRIQVRIFNTNTSRVMVETLDVDSHGGFKEDGSYTMAGVAGTGSQIDVAFIEPAGAATGALFPTGLRSEAITVAKNGLGPFIIQASLIDAANPFIFVDASDLEAFVSTTNPLDEDLIAVVEDIRRQGAVRMGIARTVEDAAGKRGTPKISLLRRPSARDANIEAQAYSMGKPHPSLQLTGSVCLAAAVCIEGTIASALSRSTATSRCMSSAPRDIRIAHPSGSVSVSVVAEGIDQNVHLVSCTVARTARRIFEGNVLYYSK